MVILRALAKDPTARYQSAEEMDADLERVDRGLRVSRETEDAATTVLRGASFPDAAATAVVPSAAATMVVGRPPAPPDARLLRLRRARSGAGRSGPGCSRSCSSPARRSPASTSTRRSRTSSTRRSRSAFRTSSRSRRRTPSQIVRDLGLKTGPRPHQTQAEQRAAGRVRVRPGPEGGRPRRQGKLRRPLGLHREAAGGRPEPRRRDGRPCGGEAHRPEPRRRRPPDPVEQAGEHRHGAEPGRRDEGRREDDRPHQRLERPEGRGVPDVRGQAYESAASQLQAQGFAVARQQGTRTSPPGS